MSDYVCSACSTRSQPRYRLSPLMLTIGSRGFCLLGYTAALQYISNRLFVTLNLGVFLFKAKWFPCTSISFWLPQNGKVHNPAQKSGHLVEWVLVLPGVFPLMWPHLLQPYTAFLYLLHALRIHPVFLFPDFSNQLWLVYRVFVLIYTWLLLMSLCRRERLRMPTIARALAMSVLQSIIKISYNIISLAGTDDHNTKLYTYKDLLTKLPEVNYATLKLIIGHLNA